jgi:hypothetical protein
VHANSLLPVGLFARSTFIKHISPLIISDSEVVAIGHRELPVVAAGTAWPRLLGSHAAVLSATQTEFWRVGKSSVPKLWRLTHSIKVLQGHAAAAAGSQTCKVASSGPGTCLESLLISTPAKSWITQMQFGAP